MQLEEQENHFLVRWRDQMVVSVNDQDALWMDTDVASLDHYLAAIKESIATYRDETSMKRILMGVLQAVLIVFVVFLLIKGIARLAGFVKRKALAANQTRFKGIRMRGYELVSATRGYAPVLLGYFLAPGRG